MAWTGSDAWWESCVTWPSSGQRRDSERAWQRVLRGASAVKARFAEAAASRWSVSARTQSPAPTLPHIGHASRQSDASVPVAASSRVAALPDAARLAARMSHDLRTPLNAVIGFSDLMRRELHGPVGDRRYRDYAEHIAQSGEQLLRATENTLAMAEMIVRAGVKDQGDRSRKCCARSVVKTAMERSPSRVAVEDHWHSTADDDDGGTTVYGCFDGYVAAFGHLLTSAERIFGANGARHVHVHQIDDQLLISVLGSRQDPTRTAEPCGATWSRSDRAAQSYPDEMDTLDLFIAQTMFALQGAQMSWQAGERADNTPEVRIVLPRAAQHCLPL